MKNKFYNFFVKKNIVASLVGKEILVVPLKLIVSLLLLTPLMAPKVLWAQNQASNELSFKEPLSAPEPEPSPEIKNKVEKKASNSPRNSKAPKIERNRPIFPMFQNFSGAGEELKPKTQSAPTALPHISLEVYAIATLQKACAPWDGPAYRIKAQTAEGPVFMASIWGAAIEAFEREENVHLQQQDNMSKTSTGLAIRCEADKCVSIDLDIKSKNLTKALSKGNTSVMGEMVYEGKKLPFLLTNEKVKSAQICN